MNSREIENKTPEASDGRAQEEGKLRECHEDTILGEEEEQPSDLPVGGATSNTTTDLVVQAQSILHALWWDHFTTTTTTTRRKEEDDDHHKGKEQQQEPQQGGGGRSVASYHAEVQRLRRLLVIALALIVGLAVCTGVGFGPRSDGSAAASTSAVSPKDSNTNAVPTTVPAPSGTFGEFPLCEICGEGRKVSKPEEEVTFAQGTNPSKCSVLEDAGSRGHIEPSLCAILPSLIGNCGCGDATDITPAAGGPSASTQTYVSAGGLVMVLGDTRPLSLASAQRWKEVVELHMERTMQSRYPSASVRSTRVEVALRDQTPPYVVSDRDQNNHNNRMLRAGGAGADSGRARRTTQDTSLTLVFDVNIYLVTPVGLDGEDDPVNYVVDAFSTIGDRRMFLAALAATDDPAFQATSWTRVFVQASSATTPTSASLSASIGMIIGLGVAVLVASFLCVILSWNYYYLRGAIVTKFKDLTAGGNRFSSGKQQQEQEQEQQEEQEQVQEMYEVDLNYDGDSDDMNGTAEVTAVTGDESISDSSLCVCPSVGCDDETVKPRNTRSASY